MAINLSLTRALAKAAKLQEWKNVERVTRGEYLVTSAQSGETYTVFGVEWTGADHVCTCEAGQHGRVCHHIGAVLLARQQAEYRRAQRRAQQPAAVAQAAQVINLTERRAVATLRIGGVEIQAEGRNLLDAIGNVARARETAAA